MRGAFVHTSRATDPDTLLFTLTLAVDLARSGHVFEDDRGLWAAHSWDEELEGYEWEDAVFAGLPIPQYARD
jgi:hypothetical protein